MCLLPVSAGMGFPLSCVFICFFTLYEEDNSAKPSLSKLHLLTTSPLYYLGIVDWTSSGCSTSESEAITAFHSAWLKQGNIE